MYLSLIKSCMQCSSYTTSWYSVAFTVSTADQYCIVPQGHVSLSTGVLQVSADERGGSYAVQVRLKHACTVGSNGVTVVLSGLPTLYSDRWYWCKEDR